MQRFRLRAAAAAFASALMAAGCSSNSVVGGMAVSAPEQPRQQPAPEQRQRLGEILEQRLAEQQRPQRPVANDAAQTGSEWMTGAEQQAEFDRRVKLGLRQTEVQGACRDGAAQYSSRWQPLEPGARFASYFGMSREWYERRDADFTTRGYQRVWLQQFVNCEGQERYQAVWLKPALSAAPVSADAASIGRQWQVYGRMADASWAVGTDGSVCTFRWETFGERMLQSCTVPGSSSVSAIVKDGFGTKTIDVATGAQRCRGEIRANQTYVEACNGTEFTWEFVDGDTAVTTSKHGKGIYKRLHAGQEQELAVRRAQVVAENDAARQRQIAQARQREQSDSGAWLQGLSNAFSSLGGNSNPLDGAYERTQAQNARIAAAYQAEQQRQRQIAQQRQQQFAQQQAQQQQQQLAQQRAQEEARRRAEQQQRASPPPKPAIVAAVPQSGTRDNWRETQEQKTQVVKSWSFKGAPTEEKARANLDERAKHPLGCDARYAPSVGAVRCWSRKNSELIQKAGQVPPVEHFCEAPVACTVTKREYIGPKATPENSGASRM